MAGSAQSTPALVESAPHGAPRLQEWLCLWIVYLVWGSTYLAIRVMVETIPPFLGAAARYLAAGALMAVWLLARHGTQWLQLPRPQLLSAGLVGVLLVGGNGLLVYGEREVPAGLAALVVATVPLWVIIFRLLARDRPRTATLAGVAVGFVGVAALLSGGRLPGGASEGGIVIILLASVAWALGSYGSGRLPMPPNALAGTAIEMLLGGAVLLGVAALLQEFSDLRLGDVSVTSAMGLLYLILFGSIVAFTAYVWLLQNVPISRVSTYAYVNPVVAVVLGALILEEEVTPIMALGGGIVVVGVALVVRAEARRPSPVVAIPETDHPQPGAASSRPAGRAP